MPAEWPPAFTDEFVDAARTLLHDAGHLMIVGPLGSGRGRLAGLISEAPLDAGPWNRHDAAARRGPRRLEVVRRLLPGTLADDATDEYVVGELHRVIGPERRTVIVREADLADEPSVALLRDLAADHTLTLVTTASPEFATDARFRRSAGTVRLDPLPADRVGALLQARFGAPAHPTTVAGFVERSYGAYQVLMELADAMWSAEQLRIVDGVLLHVGAQHDPPLARAARFTTDASITDVVAVAALCLEVDRGEAIRAFGEAEVSRTLNSGTVHRRGNHLRFTSHAEAMLVQRALSPTRRTALATRYADQLTATFALRDEADLSAAWLVSAGRTLTTGHTLRAATAANIGGRHDLALRLVRSVPACERSSRLEAEGLYALIESADDHALRDALVTVDLTLVAEDVLLPMLMWSSRFLERPAFTPTLHRARHDATRRGSTSRVAVFDLFDLLYPTYLGPPSADLARRLHRFAADPSFLTVNRAMALVHESMVLHDLGRADESLLRAKDAIELLDTVPGEARCWHQQMARERLVRSNLGTGDLAAATAAVAEYTGPGDLNGYHGRVGLMLWGSVHFFRGQLRSACAALQLSLDTLSASDRHVTGAWTASLLASIVARAGDADRAERLLELSMSHPVGPLPAVELERRLFDAATYDALGWPDTAVDILEDLLDESTGRGYWVVALYAATTLAQINGPTALPALRRVVEAMGTSGMSWVWARFLAGLQANDVDALLDLVDTLLGQGQQSFGTLVAHVTLDLMDDRLTPEARARLSVPIAHHYG